MGKKILTAGILSLSLLSATALFAEDKVVATVNGTDIKQSSLDALMDVVKRSKRGGDVDKATILDDLIVAEIARQEAAKAGFADREDIKKEIQEYKDRLILQMWSVDKVKSFEITDKELKDLYDKRMSGQPKEEYKARHILLKTEDEAKAVIEALKKEGADFAKLAKEKSTGPSGPKGGDLGWFASNAMVAPFSAAVAKMEKGKSSEVPVKTEFGFHVIKLEDKRAVKLPDLEAVKPQLKRVIEQEKMKAYVKTLRDGADVKVLVDLAAEKKEEKKAEKPAEKADTAAEKAPVEQKKD